MRRYFFLITCLVQGLLFSSHIPAQSEILTQWSVPAHLPENTRLGKQPGLAGAFTGILNNKLIVAGGANFPDSMPWAGGKKTYWNDIYILGKSKKGKFEWAKKNDYRLPRNIAYGASVTTQEGIVCIGGENEKGISEKVFLIHITSQGKMMEIIDLPDLPVPLTNLAAAASGAIIYSAGGETASAVSRRFYSLDLREPSRGWIELAPIPIEVSHAVLIRQTKHGIPYLYLAGGRKKNTNGISEFYASLFEYNIEKNEWSRKMNLPYAVSAAAGCPYGTEQILIFGGDKGEIFQKTEALIAAINKERDSLRKQLLVAEKKHVQENHPGFSRNLLLYDVKSGDWRTIGEIPFDIPVTTSAVLWNEAVYLPSGEIKAGIRTTQILRMKKYRFK